MSHIGRAVEVITKWIGNASPDITSRVYGKLMAADVNNEVAVIMGFCDTSTETVKEKWKRVRARIIDPYEFYPMEKVPPPKADRDQKHRRHCNGSDKESKYRKFLG